MNNKSTTVSVRVPKHLKNLFDLLKERGYIKETMSELMLKGLDEKVESILKQHFTETYSISGIVSGGGFSTEEIVKSVEELEKWQNKQQ